MTPEEYRVWMDDVIWLVSCAVNGESPDAEVVFIPDRETVASALVPLALSAEAFETLLSCASGAQAATVLAMRSAYDNAETSRARLETDINRLRQAGVTASVLETAADFLD